MNCQLSYLLIILPPMCSQFEFTFNLHVWILWISWIMWILWILWILWIPWILWIHELENIMSMNPLNPLFHVQKLCPWILSCESCESTVCSHFDNSGPIVALVGPKLFCVCVFFQKIWSKSGLGFTLFETSRETAWCTFIWTIVPVSFS